MNDIIPRGITAIRTSEDCSSILIFVHKTIARCCIPEEFIRNIYPKMGPQRTGLKRMREKAISDGWKLMLHLDQGATNVKCASDMLWQEKAIILWNHFSLSVERLYDYYAKDTHESS